VGHIRGRRCASSPGSRVREHPGTQTNQLTDRCVSDLLAPSGRRMQKDVPAPGSLVTTISPPCCSAIRHAFDRPKPSPTTGGTRARQTLASTDQWIVADPSAKRLRNARTLPLTAAAPKNKPSQRNVVRPMYSWPCPWRNDDRLRSQSAADVGRIFWRLLKPFRAVAQRRAGLPASTRNGCTRPVSSNSAQIFSNPGEGYKRAAAS
jgi:hypothetical protein